MIPELGSFAIILALTFAIMQFVSILQGQSKNPAKFLSLSMVAALGQFIFLILAMIALIASFLANDMSVIYVREHSHQLLPLIYRIGAAWGGHEGSVLLWCLILSGWTLAFIIFKDKKLPKTTTANIIMILGMISCGFILFLFLTSNPFLRDFPLVPIIGNDLTPILQDPGLIFHPPMLYSGYVGFAVGFAFAIAALIEGNLNKTWAEACKPWVILPWSLLGVGIVLGSWWAYRELGWGGWWFWDPVENASLLPWLCATAFIHSLVVTEKRESFKGWTILLAIITFGLSLLGTFLVRSGVLVSVHAFANDPGRGIYLLSYLALIMGSGLLIYCLRIKLFFKAPTFQLFSRETLLLINSVMLLTAMATIVIGTLYPIILDAFSSEKISVGEPYFNSVFIPIMLPLLLLMGIAPHVNWSQQSLKKLWKKLDWIFFFSIGLSLFIPYLLGFTFYWLTACGIFIGIWIIMATLKYAYLLWKTQRHIELKYWSMIIAHLGIACLVLGIVINKSYSKERQVKMFMGETVSLAHYQFTFNTINETNGPNYKSIVGNFSVQHNYGTKKYLSPELRIYPHDQLLNKTSILFNPWRDLYLALGMPLQDGSWSVRIYYKPFVRWIWFGGFMLFIGGMLSLLNYYRQREKIYE
jgi:cytochrome c-type biogenesis protein CcmF